jgi:cysteinyl-tRNA synthetase
LTLRESLKTDLDLRAFRYMVITSQYRNPLNFNGEALEAARITLRRLDRFRAALVSAHAQGKLLDLKYRQRLTPLEHRVSSPKVETWRTTEPMRSSCLDAGAAAGGESGLGEAGAEALVGPILAEFESSLSNDLNSPRAAAAVFQLVSLSARLVFFLMWRSIGTGICGT